MLLASATTVAGVRVLTRPHVEHLLVPAPVAPPVVEAPPLVTRPRPVEPAPPEELHHHDEVMAPPVKAIVSPVATSPPPEETEGHMLAAAVARLRREHDPRGALSLLDRYSEHFPRGLLAPEAERARLEALLDLGDHGTALALLDRDGAPTLDLLLVRAELRAEVARYAEAAQDFTASMSGARDDALERALFGRAVCFRKRGQEAAARADLLAYQRRFPSGKKAAEVARLLSGRSPVDSP